MREMLIMLLAWGTAGLIGADELDDVQATFQESMDTLSNRYVINDGLLREKYVKTVEAISEKKADAGDLDAVITLKKEAQRFLKEETLTRKMVVQQPVELRKVQIGYVKAQESMRANQSKAVLDLVNATEKKLEVTEQNFTKASQIDRALATREARRKLSELEAVKDARAVAPQSSAPKVVPIAGFQPKTIVHDTVTSAGALKPKSTYGFGVKQPGRYAYLRYFASGDTSTKSYGFVILTTPDGTQHRLRKWGPSDFKRPANVVTSWRRLTPTTINISKYVTKPGNYRVTFEYTNGTAALKVMRLEIELR